MEGAAGARSKQLTNRSETVAAATALPSSASNGSAEVLALAAKLSARGDPHVLLTVVRAVRPTSGKPGDKALLTATGQWTGWVGGSCAEPSARRLAAAALRSGEPTLLRLTNDKQEQGSVGVEVLPMSCFSGGALDIFIEPQCQQTRLYLLGKSPVTEALARLGAAMCYRVFQSDELPVLQGSNAGDQWPETPPGDAVVVVACHGRKERPALQWALQGNPRYVGLVASRKRCVAVSQSLTEAGVSAAALKRLDSPAGLDIGGRGPEEVALSILAGAVKKRRSVPVAQTPLAAVLVAAGLSERMGKVNKLLLPINGVAMVRRAAAVLCECPFSEVVVVLGHEELAVRQALEGLPVRFVVNEQFRTGQQASVRAGLRAIDTSSAAMICLADQPWLTKGDLLELWKAFDSRSRGEVVIPRVNGQRGNPVTLSAAAVASLLSDTAQASVGSRFIEETDERVEYWQSSSHHFIRDVDRPEDCPGRAKQESGE